MLMSDLRHRMKNTDLKVIDVLEMVKLTQWTEIIGEYLFLLTGPLKSLCFKSLFLSPGKSYNQILLNHLILRFWQLGLRHGSDWLVSLLWHQYIFLTFVDTLTVSTELGLANSVVPIQIDRSHFFAHYRKLIQNGEVNFFGDQCFLIALVDTVINKLSTDCGLAISLIQCVNCSFCMCFNFESCESGARCAW